MNLDYISNVLDQFYVLFTESFTSDYFVVLGIFFYHFGRYAVAAEMGEIDDHLDWSCSHGRSALLSCL